MNHFACGSCPSHCERTPEAVVHEVLSLEEFGLWVWVAGQRATPGAGAVHAGAGMTSAQSRGMVQVLARGVVTASGEPSEDDSPWSHLQVIRAPSPALQALDGRAGGGTRAQRERDPRPANHRRSDSAARR